LHNRVQEREQDRERIIEICGSTETVALAKSLITIAMDLGRAGYDNEAPRRDEGRRGGGEREDRRGGRWEQGGGDYHRVCGGSQIL